MANRGAVNSDMLIGIDDDTTDLAEFLADGNRMELLIDTDNTTARNFVTLKARVDPANDSLDFVIPGSIPAVGLVDWKGNGDVVSESTQQNFFTPGGVAPLTEDWRFDNSITAYEADGNVIASLHWTELLIQPGFSPADQYE